MSQYKITANNGKEFSVDEGQKLVLALEENGIDVSHRCGGQARCTTCRVKFNSPEPEMEQTEHACLEEDGELGNFRLSCQIRVNQDMNVEALMLASEQGWDPGQTVDP